MVITYRVKRLRLIVDECRKTGSQGEALHTLFSSRTNSPVSLLASDDCFIATGPAYGVTMPSKDSIIEAALKAVKGLCYLGRHHFDKADVIAGFDAQRSALGQDTVSELDAAERFSVSKFTRGDQASGLIYACSYADFLSINRDKYEIVGVTGNSSLFASGREFIAGQSSVKRCAFQTTHHTSHRWARTSVASKNGKH